MLLACGGTGTADIGQLADVVVRQGRNDGQVAVNPDGGAMTDSLAPTPRSARLLDAKMCRHRPRCPDAQAPDRIAARAVARRPEQGWTLLYNGVVLFDDAGALLPDGRAVSPAPACTVVAAA
jgi:hypothetical protein